MLLVTAAVYTGRKRSDGVYRPAQDHSSGSPQFAIAAAAAVGLAVTAIVLPSAWP